MGCLKNLFAMVGFVVVVGAGAIVAWHYRAEIKDYYQEWRASGADSVAGESVGIPGEEALRSARRKNASMELEDGPALVVLDADEMASLIFEGISREATEALDSLSVVLDMDRVGLEARVSTELFARDLLGQFASALDRTESIRVSGPMRVVDVGVLTWEPDQLRLGSIPFPGPVISPMVNAITGGSDGAFLIPVPTTVGDVRARPDGVTFYRRTD